MALVVALNYTQRAPANPSPKAGSKQPKPIPELQKPASKLQQIRKSFSRKLGIQNPQSLGNFGKQCPSTATPSSPLEKLPAEILVQILDQIPPSSATAFTFSCKHIYRLLGNKYSSILSDNSGETLAYLQLLDKDLPDQIVCRPCGRLHKMASVEWYANCAYSPHWRSSDYQGDHSRPYHVQNCCGDGFNTIVFQMAMKQHKLGLNCGKFLKIISQDSPPKEGKHCILRNRTDYTIVQGYMIQRVQSAVINIRWMTLIEVPGVNFPADICSHLRLDVSIKSLSINKAPFFENRYLWERSWYKDSPGQKTLERDDLTGSGLHRCKHCYTEVQIDLDYSSDYGLVVVCTRWKNLGSDPHHSDPIWRGHVEDGGCCTALTPRASSQVQPRIKPIPGLDPLAVAFDNEEELLLIRNHRNDARKELEAAAFFEKPKWEKILRELNPRAYCPY
jgi:hypothetical protein